MHRIEFNCKWCRVPTCTGSLILNQQVLLFLTSGLLQLALVAVVFAVGAANLQERQDDYNRHILLNDIIKICAVSFNGKNAPFSSPHFQRIYILKTYQWGLKDNVIISEVRSEFYAPGF